MNATQSQAINVLNQLNVLFADDDTILRDTIGETLGMFFNQVILASNGVEAYEQFQKQSVHVVILDISMPLLNGLSVAQKIREQDEQVPILIMTSYKEESQLMTAIKLNLVDYLVKPVNFQTLKDTLIACAQQVTKSGRLLQTFKNGTEYHILSNTVISEEGRFTLTKNERLFLNILLKRRGQLIRIDEVESQLGDEDYSAAGLRNLVYRLRKKLGKDAIVSVKDLGYLTP